MTNCNKDMRVSCSWSGCCYPVVVAGGPCPLHVGHLPSGGGRRA